MISWYMMFGDVATEMAAHLEYAGIDHTFQSCVTKQYEITPSLSR